MISGGASILERYEQRLKVEFRRSALVDFLREENISEGEVVADLIERDGRARIERDIPVSLNDYLTSVPKIRENHVVLDAAIDMALRSLSGSSRPTEHAVRELIRAHPDLEPQIREAAALGLAIWTTDEIQQDSPRQQVELPLEIGHELSEGMRRYTLLEPVGKGAFGDVFKARDNMLSDPDKPAWVAVKLLAGRPMSEADRWRFTDEATKSRRVTHENVARVLDRGVTDDGHAYIVHEYIPGETLEAFISDRRSSLDARTVAKLIACIARGVQAIHSAGLAHCDLKPSNVLSDEHGVPKIVDMGIARRLEHESLDDDEELNRPLGSLAFMAPEQYFMAPDAAAPPADIYAVGGLLYWALTGRCPNGDDAEAIRAAFASEESRRDYNDSRIKHDRSLKQVAERALSFERTSRYSTAASLADDLEAWAQKRPIGWQHPSMLRRLSLAIQRRPLSSILGAIAIIAALAGVLIALRFQLIAERRAEETQKKEAEVVFERRWRESVLPFVEAMSRLVNDISESDFHGKQLFTIDLTTWYLSPQMSDWAEGVQDMRDLRIEVMQDRLNEAEESFGPCSLEAMSLAVRLGWQHLMDERPELAIPVFEDAQLAFGAILEKDDPWLTAIDVMRLTAEADVFLPDPLEEGYVLDKQAASELAAELDARLTELTALSKGLATSGPIRKQGIIRLLEFYSPGILDDEARHLAWMNEFEAIQRVNRR